MNISEVGASTYATANSSGTMPYGGPAPSPAFESTHARVLTELGKDWCQLKARGR